MNKDQFKAVAASIKELSSLQVEAANSIRSANASSSDAGKKLWRGTNKPFLIKAGLALIAFPDPTVSDVVGTALLAAGAIQLGIKRRSAYVDDLPKAFQSAMRDLKGSKDLL